MVSGTPDAIYICSFNQKEIQTIEYDYPSDTASFMDLEFFSTTWKQHE